MWSLPSYKIQSRLCFCGSIYSLRNLKCQSHRCYVRTWRSGQLSSTFSKKGGIYVHPWQTNTRLWDVLEPCLSNLLSPEVSSTLFDLGEAPSFAYGSRLLLKSKVVGQQWVISAFCLLIPYQMKWRPTNSSQDQAFPSIPCASHYEFLNLEARKARSFFPGALWLYWSFPVLCFLLMGGVCPVLLYPISFSSSSWVNYRWHFLVTESFVYPTALALLSTGTSSIRSPPTGVSLFQAESDLEVKCASCKVVFFPLAATEDGMVNNEREYVGRLALERNSLLWIRVSFPPLDKYTFNYSNRKGQVSSQSVPPPDPISP